jgi:hypothetical protein
MAKALTKHLESIAVRSRTAPHCPCRARPPCSRRDRSLELAAFYAKINVAHAKIATIATDDHHPLQEFRNSVGAQWPFLSDPGRTVQKDLEHPGVHGPRQRPDDPAHSRAETRLIVHSIYNGYWFWGRPSLVDLWHDLRDVTREIRPD